MALRGPRVLFPHAPASGPLGDSRGLWGTPAGLSRESQIKSFWGPPSTCGPVPPPVPVTPPGGPRGGGGGQDLLVGSCPLSKSVTMATPLNIPKYPLGTCIGPRPPFSSPSPLPFLLSPFSLPSPEGPRTPGGARGAGERTHPRGSLNIIVLWRRLF